MPLFDVPGWTIPSNPTVDVPSGSSKKRKRPASSADSSFDNTQSNPVVSERKIKQLFSRKGGNSKERKRILVHEEKKKSISRPRPLGSTGAVVVRSGDEGEKSADSTPNRPTKRVKWDDSSSSRKKDGSSAAPSQLTKLQKDMKASLDGARFRLINESLYKTDSAEAVNMMRENPKVFEEYHVGFRHQVQSWPTNPVSYYIDALSARPTGTCVADLGCGDAALAQALIPKSINVISFDLVSDGVYVVEADVCCRIPLPGSEGQTGGDEKTAGEGGIVDVVVCALSLMGTNWTGCIREAWRILKAGGELKIAEVASRFVDVKEFTSLITSIGFKLKSKDATNTHFTLFEFVKTPRKPKNEQAWAQVLESGSVLKPCEYKRR